MRASRHTLTIPAAQAGIRLDAFLAEWLPGQIGLELSRSAVRRLIMAGAIALDGRPVRRPRLVLEAGSRVDARIDVALLSRGSSASLGASAAGQAGSSSAAPSSIEILYRDPWLLAVAKPSGLLVHASADSRRPDLFSMLRRTLQAPYLGLHHRLDLETSGVMLFTLDPSANLALSRAFAEHRVEKVYHALVARPDPTPPDRWVESAALATVGTGRHARMSAVTSGGVAAETEFAIHRRLPSALVIEARPWTGRKHQIRAHLASRNLQVLGDVRYGGATAIGGRPVGRVMLHALSLRLQHPVTGDLLHIHCRYPEDFRDLLAALESHAAGSGASLDSRRASR